VAARINANEPPVSFDVMSDEEVEELRKANTLAGKSGKYASILDHLAAGKHVRIAIPEGVQARTIAAGLRSAGYNRGMSVVLIVQPDGKTAIASKADRPAANAKKGSSE
jgi:hypothetical protein